AELCRIVADQRAIGGDDDLCQFLDGGQLLQLQLQQPTLVPSEEPGVFVLDALAARPAGNDGDNRVSLHKFLRSVRNAVYPGTEESRPHPGPSDLVRPGTIP